jgi:polysaccharide chain length determinant protein (PEP-CTERM system associated)
MNTENQHLANPKSGSEISLDEIVQNAVGLVIRRRWYVLVVACATILYVQDYVRKLPDVYQSEATIAAVEQQVSTRYVEPDSTATVAQRVQAMTEQVLSKDSLLRIIDDLGLYPTERKDLTPEWLADRMHADLRIEPIGPTQENQFSAFKVLFRADNPTMAQQVTNRLAALFIEENQRARGRVVRTTTSFLADQVRVAEARLRQQEARLQAFKTGYMGELPEQQQMNLQALTDLRMQLQQTTTGLNQVQQRRSFLELSLTDRLSRAQAERTALLGKFTARHRDVLAKDQEIARIRSLIDRVRSGGSKGGKQDTSLDLEDPALGQLRDQIEASASEAESLSRYAETLKGQIAEYEQRLNMIPIRDQQLAQLQRDYNLYHQEYTELKNKQLEQGMAAHLEERKEGDQFRIINSASLPVAPLGPRRERISLAGWVAGLAMGIALAYLRDKLNPKFHVERELRRMAPTPIIVGIPPLPTTQERMWRIGAGAVQLLVASVLVGTVLSIQYQIHSFGR